MQAGVCVVYVEGSRRGPQCSCLSLIDKVRVTPRDEEGYERSSRARGRCALQCDRVAARMTTGSTVPDHRR